jgi:hypothetical protein
MDVPLEYAVMDCATAIYLTIKHAHQIMTVKACFVNSICALEIARIKVFTKAILIIWW